MTDVISAIEEAKASGDPRALVEAIPYARLLGISVEDRTEGLIGKLAYDDSLIGNAALPALHGGTIGALLESIATFQTLWESKTVSLPKIVTITVDFLRSGRPVDTFAQARITRRGKRVVNVTAEAWQEERSAPIARATAHFLIAPQAAE